MNMLFISVYSTRIDLQNATCSFNVSEEIPIKIADQ